MSVVCLLLELTRTDWVYFVEGLLSYHHAMTDIATIIAQAQAGDVDAFNRIVLHFQDMAVAYAYSQLGDYHLSQDAAQEAFVGAFVNLKSLQNPSAFPSWFRRIILTQSDRLTRRKQISTEPLSRAEDVASDRMNPEEHVDDGEMRRKLFLAIQSLPELDRAVVLLIYMAQRSQDETASFLEIPVTKVNNRLYASRKRLKKELMTMDSTKLQPSEDPKFSMQVTQQLHALEELHGKLAILMQSLISEGLEADTQVAVGGASQETYVDFIQQLPNPSCTLVFKLSPLEGWMTFNLPMSLAWKLLERQGRLEAAQRWDKEQRIVWEEIVSLVPFMKHAISDLGSIWESLELKPAEIEVETNPLLLLAMPEFRSAEPLETIVHLRLDVESNDYSDSLSLCYAPVSLRSLLPHLN